MQPQILTFGMARMSVGSCSDFHNKVLHFIEVATPAALHIEGMLPAYKASVATLASVVNREKAYVATETLIALDKDRDNGVGTINSVINAYKTSLVEQKRKWARLLAPQLAAYKGISRHEYTKQTAEVNGMLGVLDKPGNSEAVEGLGIDDDREALRAAQEAFDKAYLEKTAEESEKGEVSDLESKDLMADANKKYEEIIRVVNAYAIVQTSEEIEAFVKSVNGLVRTFAKVSGSDTSTDAPEPEPEIPETPDEETPGEGDNQPSEGGDEDDRPVVQ